MSYYKHSIVDENDSPLDWGVVPLWYREQQFTDIVTNFDPEALSYHGKYAIVWEDPDEDAPCKITRPSPVWLAMAMHGGIIPPVQVYWALAEDEANPEFKKHTRGHLLHDTPTMRPLTEEEAMQYLVMKDVPPRVWRDYRGNKTILKIVPIELIPTNRENRNAWAIQDLGEAA